MQTLVAETMLDSPPADLTGTRLLVAATDGFERTWLYLVLEGCGARVVETTSAWSLVTALGGEGPFDALVVQLPLSRLTASDIVELVRSSGLDDLPCLFIGSAADRTPRSREGRGPLVSVLATAVSARALALELRRLLELSRGHDTGLPPAPTIH